jgi:molecular chaperone GrpE (heat shock protein)
VVRQTPTRENTVRRFALTLAVTATGLALLAGCSATTPAAAPATTATSAAATTTPAAPTTSAPSETATPTETTAAPTTGTNAADCAALEQMLLGSATELTEGMAKLQTKPKKALKMLEGFADKFRDAIAQVDNADVADTATEALEALDAMNAALADLFKDPQSMTRAEFQKVATKVQTEFADIDTVCAA